MRCFAIKADFCHFVFQPLSRESLSLFNGCHFRAIWLHMMDELQQEIHLWLIMKGFQAISKQYSATEMAMQSRHILFNAMICVICQLWGSHGGTQHLSLLSLCRRQPAFWLSSWQGRKLNGARRKHYMFIAFSDHPKSIISTFAFCRKLDVFGFLSVLFLPKMKSALKKQTNQ